MPFKEQELILAQESAQLAIWEWHVDSDALRWLPGSVELFGRPMADVRSRQTVFEFMHEEDRERVSASIRAALSHREDFDVEFRVAWPAGETHWIRSCGRVVDSPDRGTLMIGVSQDITESKEKEDSLRAQARLLELAYEPILVRDAANKITYWNKGAERLYGYTWKEANGQRSHDLLCTRFPEPLHDIEARLAQNGYWEGELIHCTKDKRLLHVASRWQTFSNESMSVLETNFDLSQQKALQVARLWEEKAKLLGEMSHEINNPLAAATSAAHLLKNGCEQPVQRYIEVLEESINRIADFIRKSNELHQSGRIDEQRLQDDVARPVQ